MLFIQIYIFILIKFVKQNYDVFIITSLLLFHFGEDTSILEFRCDQSKFEMKKGFCTDL